MLHWAHYKSHIYFMQQVATFPVPEKQKECNKFLTTIKPAQLSYRDGNVVIFYDDGTYPASYQLADLQEHLQSVRAARFQQEVAVHVAKAELASLNRLKNKGRFEEVDQAIRNIQDAIQIQNIKEGFVLKRIEELSK
jgi:hypothetical protein